MSSTGYLTGYLDKEAYGKKPGGRKFSSGSYNHLGVYGDTKLMQVLTAREFSKRFSRKDVSFNSVCPGFVATGFQEKMGDHIFARIVRFIQMFYARTPPQGASRPIQVLTDPKYSQLNGVFVDAYLPLPSILAYQVTDENSKWIYEKSNELVGLKS